MDDRRDVGRDMAREMPADNGRGTGAPDGPDALRIVLIALGVVLLVASLPLLFMGGMMGMMIGGPGFMGILALLVLAAGAVILVVGIRRR